MNPVPTMSGLDRFLFSFFNPEIAGRYWKAIAEGFLLTTWLGITVIVTGLILGLALAVARAQQVKVANFFNRDRIEAPAAISTPLPSACPPRGLSAIWEGIRSSVRASPAWTW